jgi:hypothetical protein
MDRAEKVKWRLAKPPVSQTAARKAEQAWGIEFPSDYFDCATLHHGAYPFPKSFPIPGRRPAMFGHLLPFSDATADDQNRSLNQVYAAIKEWLPARVFPFAADPFGNYLCFDYRKQKPTIVFWNHEEDDPTKALNYVCSTFTELLELLYEANE